MTFKMPEPVAYCREWDASNEEAFSWNASPHHAASLFTADQVTAAYRQGVEDAAKVCDAIRDDAKEAEALAKFNLAMDEGPERDAVARGEFWSTVSMFNAGLKRAAASIRSLLDGADSGKGADHA